MSCILLLPVAAWADIVIGPGSVTGPINVSVEPTFVVGSTIVSTGSNTAATNVTGSVLTLDALLGPAPGAITIQSLTGNGLQANGGAIVASGATVQSQNGHTCLANGSASTVTLNGVTLGSTGTGAGLAAIGGAINAGNTIVNNAGTSIPTVSAGHGAIAETGGTVLLGPATSIATGAFNAVGLGASGNNSIVSVDGLVPVTMNGRGAMGIYLHDGGEVRPAPGSTLQMKASNGVGVAVDNTVTAAAALDHLSIQFDAIPSVGQAAGTGVVVFNGGSLAIEDLTVQGVGAGAGVWARPGSSITLAGESGIRIEANANPVFYTLQTAFLITSSGSVSSIFGVTSGLPIGALLANAGHISDTGTQIEVTSTNGVGAYAGFSSASPMPSRIELAGTRITTTGTSSYGIQAASHGEISAEAIEVTSSGGGAAVFLVPVNGPATVVLDDATIRAEGTNTAGLLSANFSPDRISLVQLSGGSLGSAEGAAVVAAAGPLAITLSDGMVLSSSGPLVDASMTAPAPQPTSVDIMASTGTSLTGDLHADAQSRIDLELASGSHWEGAAFGAARVALDNSSTWIVTADSALTDTLDNAGQVRFDDPSGFRTLATANFSGAGGTITLRTELGEDASPSDRLVIEGGTASGTTLLNIVNVAGIGAPTTGNGILVVDAVGGASTDEDAFELAAPLQIRGYRYTLHRGSLDAANPQAWYLRSVPPDVAVSIEVSLPGEALYRGDPTGFDLIVSNAGPQDAHQATVEWVLPNGLADAAWQCSAGANSVCTAQGIGGIADTVDIAANATLRYSVDAMVTADAPDIIHNTAAVASAAAQLDDPADDNVTWTLEVDGIFRDGLEPGPMPRDLPTHVTAGDGSSRRAR